jgi:steroid delta-isomerase-like uncharacterized protein
MHIAHIVLASALATTVVVTAFAASPAAASNASACSQAHRAEVEAAVDLYIEIFNDHDMSRLHEVMTPESLNENPFGVMDVETLAATMEGFYAAFPDLQYQVEDVAINGDRVVLEYTYTGTHLGPLMGVPATGTVVHGRGLEIHTFDDGRITGTRNYSDVFGLFAQLGLL